jgi:hypothetical protein
VPAEVREQDGEEGNGKTHLDDDWLVGRIPDVQVCVIVVKLLKTEE